MIISRLVKRKEAKAFGWPTYFTGKPCVRGHVYERSTVVKNCLLCRREDQKKYALKHPEKIKARHRISNAGYKRSRAKKRAYERKFIAADHIVRELIYGSNYRRKQKTSPDPKIRSRALRIRRRAAYALLQELLQLGEHA